MLYSRAKAEKVPVPSIEYVVIRCLTNFIYGGLDSVIHKFSQRSNSENFDGPARIACAWSSHADAPCAIIIAYEYRAQNRDFFVDKGD